MTRKLLLFILSLLCVAALCACGNASSNFPSEDEYSSEQLELGSVNRFAGVVMASSETKIEKDSTKTLASVSVAAGDDVKAGQVLFTYDSQQAQLDYDKAAIELEQLQVTLESYSGQKSALEAEKANAGESEQLSYTIQIQELDTQIRETSYNISLKQTEVEKLRNSLNNLEVKSPTDGKVQSVNTDGGTDANGSPLPFIVIMKTNAYRVKAYINEENAMDLSLGSPVVIRSRTGDTTWTGIVSSIDFENPATSSSGMMNDMGTSDVTSSSKYPLYVDLDSSEGLMLGQHVFVEKAQ